MEQNILLGLLFISWSIACYHAIRAHTGSPDASAFRSFWNNRYSQAGKRHIRLHFIWLVICAILASVLLLNSD